MAYKNYRVEVIINRIEWLQEMYREWNAKQEVVDLNEEVDDSSLDDLEANH